MATALPSLPALERQVTERQLKDALETILQMLQALDRCYGRLEQIELGDITSDGTIEDVAFVFCTRAAAAISSVLLDPELNLTPGDYELLLMHHRWLDLIYSLSGFRTSDHLVPLLAKDKGGRWAFQGPTFLRLLALRCMNSRLPVDFDLFWKGNTVGAALAFLYYISSRYVFWPRAFDFRERLLEWIPGRLASIRLGVLTLSRLPEIYMHCSYAMTPKKHAIKADLMKQLRRACLAAGCREVSQELPKSLPKNPTIVVVAEQLISGHSVHRTHSRAIESLRQYFHVIGVIHPSPVALPISNLFDECIPIPPVEFLSGVRQLADAIVQRKPVLILYLGVGMVAQVIALASLRLAPIQCVSFGHTATTMSETMDYFVLPDDFAGAEQTFSEKVLALPKEAMPFAPRPFTERPRPTPDGTVRVAIAASTMKLNPKLFEAVSRIVSGAKSPTEVHFFPLAGTGLPYVELARAVRAQVPGAKVFPELPHDAYMERLSKCDLFLSPFPYGNMNGIIDAFRYAMPGVCLDGEETHSHTDSAFFRRVGLPSSLVAKSIDEYVAAAIALIDNSDWRSECRDIVAKADLDTAFFRGDPGLFCDALADLIAQSRANNEATA